MGFFICHDCKAIFQHPRTEQELHHELDNNDAEEYEVCPSCGSENFDKATKCEVCGEYVETTTMIGMTDVCVHCHKSIDGIVKHHLAEMVGELVISQKVCEELDVKSLFIERIAEG